MHKPNVTVAAIVKNHNEYLLVKERDKFTKQICYNQPAGHLEKNETLAQAASRELYEETGLSLTPTGFLGVYNLYADNGVHYLRFCFLFDASGTNQQLNPIDDDIISAHWFNLEKVKSLPLRSPLVQKCIDDAVTRPLLSLDTIYN
ncbi:NUDIX domain-containing protein [Pseudoalteromonas marina]|jgi:ADP-ribose pyrophosphatase YjhB (NUDIX family)|uniref:NUDIX domain-containing protein n=1 Tax=Pseudoalteromonas marina TaxID=267375 RepID=UPI003C37D96A